jgi:hypothetical protein
MMVEVDSHHQTRLTFLTPLPYNEPKKYIIYMDIVVSSAGSTAHFLLVLLLLLLLLLVLSSFTLIVCWQEK